MVTVADQRKAAQLLVAEGLSERRSARLLNLHRSMLRYQSRKVRDEVLEKRLRELAELYPVYGYRRMHQVLLREGMVINKKKVQRVWRELGFMRSQKVSPRKIRTGSTLPEAATRPNEVWSYDFIFDRTVRGETLKFLVLIDEFTRECLSLTVKPNFRSADVQEVLRSVIQTRGAPEFLRSDNGSEFIASELRIFLGLLGVGTKYIEPGKPWQNGKTESFNARFREECLNREVFHTVWEASVVTGRFRDHYNQVRLHSGLGYLPPAEFRAKWDASRMEIS